MKRTTISLAAAVAVLAVIVGIATLTRPSEDRAAAAAAPQRVPVQRADAVCPQVRGNPDPSIATVYAGFAPAGGQAGQGDAAKLAELTDPTKERGALQAPGTPLSVKVDGPEVPALGWKASGAYAPGFAAQATTSQRAGSGRGLAGVVCQTPGTDQWFVGTSTAPGRDAYLYLSNSTAVSAQVDVELYGPNGQIAADGVRSLTFPPGGTQNILLRSIQADVPVAAVHVLVRSGRVAAALRDQQGALGTDWLPQAGRPGRSFVIPGVPGDASNVRLAVFGASDTDTEVGIEIMGKASTFKPAGFESVTVKRGQVAELDLGPITQGEASAIKLTAARSDVLVGARVTRGTGDQTDAAFLTATPVLSGRAVLADNRVGQGVENLVYLTATQDAPAKVRLTGTAGAEAKVADVEVPAGTTVAVPAPAPANTDRFALVIEPQANSGPVHAARMISELNGKIPMFTIQGTAPARDTADLPDVRGDMAIMVPEQKAASGKK